MHRLFATSAFCVALCGLSLLFAADLQAQQTPYGPKKFQRTELIDTGGFQKIPFTMPWTLVSTRLVSVRGREDFEQLYDERFTVIVDQLREAYRNGEEIIEADGRALGDSNLTHLRVMGTSIEDDRARFTLGQPGLSQHLIIDVVPRGRQTVITIRSTSIRMVYSGVVPARAPMRPANAQPVPFRWN